MKFFCAWLAAFFLACALTVPLTAQSTNCPEPVRSSDPSMSTGDPVDLTAERIPLADLSRAAWRFHPGDDAAWSSPAFDDARWGLLAGNKTWDAQGYRHLGGYGWYRIHLKVPAGERLAFSPGHVFDNFQVYANGRLMAEWGKMAPGSVALYGETVWGLVVQIPPDLTATGDLVIAIRVYHDPSWAKWHPGGFGVVTKIIGQPDAVAEQLDMLKAIDLMRWMPRLLVFFVSMLAGLLSLMLFVRERKSSEYLWFGIYQLVIWVRYTWIFSSRHWFHVWNPLRDGITGILLDLSLVASVVFFFRFIGQPINRWTRWLLWAQIPVMAVDIVFTVLNQTNLATDTLLSGVNSGVIRLTILWLIIRHWRRSKAARRLALPLILIIVADLWATYLQMLYTLGYTLGNTSGADHNLILYPFTLSREEAAQIVFLAAMAYILTERFAETQREQSRLSGEFEAARTIQQVLIPDIPPEVPGLEIVSSYLPAEEVGGDFFQVIPAIAGGAIVVIGDVAGHGLQAAMTVSLMVGALRMSVESEASPSKIMAGLNRRLHGRGAGFTTCIVLHIAGNGRVLAANAGHLQPYLDGVEMSVDAGLPLGFALDIDYEETGFEMPSGSMLTLLTDGIVEATNPGRELFGFDRTQAVSRESAEAIVHAAQSFQGEAMQADDMTVLTIVRRGVAA